MAEIPVAVPDSVIITERQSAMAGSGVGDCLTAQFFQGGQSAPLLTMKPLALSASTGLLCRTVALCLFS